MSPTTIAVTGATGRLGRPLVDILEDRGHQVVPISRATGVDVVTGDGLAEALRGVEVVVDAATGPSPDEASATAFFTASAENVQRAGAEAGVERLVLVSIVGIDPFEGGYNGAKKAQERIHEAGPLPVQVVRATQFHEFIGLFVAWSKQGDVYRVPDMRTQPVDAPAAAAVLADVATAPDAPARTEVAGPRAERLVDLARALTARRGETATVEEVPADPDDRDAVLYATGAILPGPGAILTGPTYAEWLETAEVAA
jgi:uncharacterized protein YbjT (DUF2867 family)